MSDEDDFDFSAAGLRSDGSDLQISVEVLAGKLETRCHLRRMWSDKAEGSSDAAKSTCAKSP
ncbi:MAG TPA: hypothetical protein VGI26_10590 [Solirubrobacteraceae bacterium]|jgi:hypothetical protein